jgi:hypothetical protein
MTVPRQMTNTPVQYYLDLVLLNKGVITMSGYMSARHSWARDIDPVFGGYPEIDGESFTGFMPSEIEGETFTGFDPVELEGEMFTGFEPSELAGEIFTGFNTMEMDGGLFTGFGADLLGSKAYHGRMH